MYIPASFAVSDPPTLHAFIERHSFGTLISQVDGDPFATHVPFLLETTSGPLGTLMGHLARANPQGMKPSEGQALAIFSGPHAYISPSWYQTENLVPTWNFTAVHAVGQLQWIEERETILSILQRSVAFYESVMPQPWQFDATGPIVERLLAQIIGFRMVIERLEGKWKLNQNYPPERRQRVIAALRARGDENSLAIADLMEATLSTPGTLRLP